MKNNAHQETHERRLQRFQSGPPVEVIETLLNSIDNYFNNELRLTPEQHQTSLMFLGIHAVALTISEAFYNQRGPEGYKHFLTEFVDGDTDDTRFSEIADLLHGWRNVLAHQWLGSVGHTIGYDYTATRGWETQDNGTIINPRIYCEHYLNAFGVGGKIWNYSNLLSSDELEAAKTRIIRKYTAN